MKKLILTTIIALVSVVGAFAQETADVAVSATVNGAITLTPSAVSFGVIAADTQSYIEANGNDSGTDTNVGTGHTAGALQIQGTAGVDLTVSWTTGTLTDGGGANPITFTPSVWTTTEISSGVTNLTLTGGGITLDVGGTLGAISTAGVYSTGNGGTASPVTFTVNYTNL